jgi:hypothetical protein
MKSAPFSYSITIFAVLASALIAGGIVGAILGGTDINPILGGTVCGFLSLPIGSVIRASLAAFMAKAKGLDGEVPYAFSPIVRYAIGLIIAAVTAFGIISLSGIGLMAITGSIIALITNAVVSVIMFLKVSSS